MPDDILKIPREVARHLGFYVYLYVDPRSNRPFYVGKGVGERVLAHLNETGETRKVQAIDELRQLGLQPRIEILAHQLADEDTALRIEAAVIDLCGLGELTNRVRGWRSIQLGRMPLTDLIAYYAAKPVTVADPVILIRINKLYRHGMSAHELYEATRGVWKVGAKRQNAKYVFAVFEAVVREVYVIEGWHPAGSTAYTTRPASDLKVDGRWEFTGRVADDSIRARYLLGSVEAHLPKGSQNPIAYVNI